MSSLQTLINDDVKYVFKYRNIAGTLFSLGLLLFNTDIYSQEQSGNDTIHITDPNYYYRIWEDRLLYGTYWPLNTRGKLIPLSLLDNDKNPFFYDSLKIKASRRLITKKLFEFVVVPGKSYSSKQISGTSDRDFKQYSGKIIRKIEIKRLNVFGTDINNPNIHSSSPIENLLNKTHINTIENIIRKNLLFTEGDTLSPLVISDNERLLRQLPYINDSRIIVVSESDNYVDVLVVTRDIYSIGGSVEFNSVKKGSVSAFDKNIFGFGHELRIKVPYDSDSTGSPGLGLYYNINNISKSFINLNLFYYNALGKKMYGFKIDRKLVSATTRYAGGISLNQTFTTEDLDTLPKPEPLKFTCQDFWLSRSFLLNEDKVTRLIISARYKNNNVFQHPYISPDSYHNLQKYRMFLASAAFSAQKFYKANLIYGYGRTEDIPFGGLITVTAGKEINEFKHRFYTGIDLSAGNSFHGIGYLSGSAGISSFFSNDKTEQGLFFLRAYYFTNLLWLGTHRMRNFFKADYTRGFGRYTDEYLLFNTKNGFTGFRNDSLRAEKQRLTFHLESVLFSPRKIYGFRYAYFAFADLGYLFGTNEFVNQGKALSRIGLGVRLRNDNLVFNTLQIKLSYYPNLPQYSRVNNFEISGEQLLNPDNYEPGPPSLLPYR